MANKTKVKADWRYSSIDLGVEGVDALTTEGADLSKKEIDALQEAAPKQGFLLEEIDGGEYVLRPRTERDEYL